MLITYYGHSLFALEMADGSTLVTDPYDESVGYPMGRLMGDVVTVSHEHHDHNNVSLVEGSPVEVRGEGVFLPLPGLKITGIPAFHDDQGGIRRGKNTLLLIEADNLRLLHLGDLGHPLAEKTCDALRPIDILMAPVGGYYTIDALQAKGLMEALRPRVVIPMHYRTRQTERLPIAPVEQFWEAMGVSPAAMPLLRVTREDLSQQPKIAFLTTRPLPVPFPG